MLANNLADTFWIPGQIDGMANMKSHTSQCISRVRGFAWFRIRRYRHENPWITKTCIILELTLNIHANTKVWRLGLAICKVLIQKRQDQIVLGDSEIMFLSRVRPFVDLLLRNEKRLWNAAK